MKKQLTAETTSSNLTNEDYRQLLRDIDETADNLSDWEADFLESLFAWKGNFTPKQRQVVYKIAKQVCPHKIPRSS
jgi:hypothetical protein